MMQGNSKQMVVHRLMSSLDFNNRHFGAACDRGFQGLSNYHISQKFGQFGVKLHPLERNVIADLTDGEDVEEIPKDERVHFKRIYKYESMPVLALVKSFEIDWVKDSNSDVDKKTSTSLQLNFHTSLAILNNNNNVQEFFQKHLQLLERNTIALKQKGLSSLKQKVGKFETTEFTPSQLIKNQSGLGYFKVSFPIIEIYFQQYQFMGKVNLSASRLYDIVKNNFVEVEYIVQDFPLDRSQFKQQDEERLQIEQQFKNQLQEEKKQPADNILNEIPELQAKQPEEPPAVANQLDYNEMGLIIKEKKSEFLDKILLKRQIKQVVQKDEKSFFVVDFLPCQLSIKEKVSQKTIKTYSPTLKEFNNLLQQLTSKHFKQVLDEYVETSFDMPPEAFDYKEFKKGTKIKFTLPQSDDLISEITEEHLTNGLSSQWVKEIEINNKDLQIIAEPCVLEIYNQLTCKTEKRTCTSKDLTKITQKQYMIEFKLI